MINGVVLIVDLSKFKKSVLVLFFPFVGFVTS